MALCAPLAAAADASLRRLAATLSGLAEGRATSGVSDGAPRPPRLARLHAVDDGLALRSAFACHLAYVDACKVPPGVRPLFLPRSTPPLTLRALLPFSMPEEKMFGLLLTLRALPSRRGRRAWSARWAQRAPRTHKREELHSGHGLLAPFGPLRPPVPSRPPAQRRRRTTGSPQTSTRASSDSSRR